MTGVELTIQVLTCCALVGLLGAVGLRLSWGEVSAALARCRFGAIVLVNFLAVPAVAVLLVVGFGLGHEVGIGIILLATSPVAPVVPVFGRMARADLGLAAALTGVFPALSALLTPLAVRGALWLISDQVPAHFEMWKSLGLLVATITLPLIAGIVLRHRAPALGRRLLKPVEATSETIGAISLAFVTATQFGLILNLGWRSWLAMAFLSEISLGLGWLVGGPKQGSRQVVALGTSNRNIALALLIAIESFPGTEVASAVAGNGLLLIGLGLVHVAWWRFGPRQSRSA